MSAIQSGLGRYPTVRLTLHDRFYLRIVSSWLDRFWSQLHEHGVVLQSLRIAFLLTSLSFLTGRHFDHVSHSVQLAVDLMLCRRIDTLHKVRRGVVKVCPCRRPLLLRREEILVLLDVDYIAKVLCQRWPV